MEGPGEASVRRSRRAFARRQWGRRWLRWRPVLAGLLLVAVLSTTVWLVWFSQVLAVAEVRVSGTDVVRSRSVEAATEGLMGVPLARVDLDRLHHRVAAIAEVRDVRVSREWPDTVVVSIQEREPLAAVEVAGRLKAMDADGKLFDVPGGLGSLPRVQTSGATTGEALREAASVVAALPADLAGRVDHVQVATVDQVSLVLGDGRTVAWGSADDSDLKAEVLAALLAEADGAQGPQAGSDIDVSVPGRPSFTS